MGTRSTRTDSCKACGHLLQVTVEALFNPNGELYTLLASLFGPYEKFSTSNSFVVGEPGARKLEHDGPENPKRTSCASWLSGVSSKARKARTAKTQKNEKHEQWREKRENDKNEKRDNKKSHNGVHSAPGTTPKDFSLFARSCFRAFPAFPVVRTFRAFRVFRAFRTFPIELNFGRPADKKILQIRGR